MYFSAMASTVVPSNQQKGRLFAAAHLLNGILLLPNHTQYPLWGLGVTHGPEHLLGDDLMGNSHLCAILSQTLHRRPMLIKKLLRHIQSLQTLRRNLSRQAKSFYHKQALLPASLRLGLQGDHLLDLPIGCTAYHIVIPF